MAILDFPTSPNINDLYTQNGRTYIWTGSSWKSYFQETTATLQTITSAGNTTNVSVSLTSNLSVGNISAFGINSNNYIQIAGASTSNTSISTLGGDANINLILNQTGNGFIIANGPSAFGSNTGIGSDVVRVYRDNTPAGGGAFASFTSPAFAFFPRQSNYGAPIFHFGGDVRIAGSGTDGIYLGTGATLGFAGTTQFKIGHTGSAVNYLQARGAPAANVPTISSQGTDTNIGVALQSKGTGAIDLVTGSGGINISTGNTITAITRTAAGSNYTSAPNVIISAPTSAGGIQATANSTIGASTITSISSGGTGYTPGDVLTISGGTFTVAAQLTVTTVSSNVITAATVTTGGSYSIAPSNPVSVTGGTGSSATFNINFSLGTGFTITNAGSGYIEQPTVTLSGGGSTGATAYATVGSNTILRSLGGSLVIYTPSGPAAGFVSQTATTVNQVNFVAAGTGGQPGIYSSGSDTNPGINFSTKGAGSHNFYTNTYGQLQFQVAHTASAVNYVQVSGGAAGSGPAISAQGTDANVALTIRSKGAAGLNFNKTRDAATSNPHLFTDVGGLTNDGANGFWRGVQYSGPTYTISGVNKFPRVSQYFEFQSLTDPTYKNFFYGIGNSANENIEMNFSNETSGGWTFKYSNVTSSDKSFRIATPNISDRNYLQVAGAFTANVPALSAQGTDANVGLLIQSKGTGNIDLAVRSGAINISAGNTITAITRTTTGSGYTSFPNVIISAPTTFGGVQANVSVAQMFASAATIQNGGTGYTLNDVLTISGGTPFTSNATFTVTGVSGGAVTTVTALNFAVYGVLPVNPVTTTGGTGTGCNLNVTFGIQNNFTITNAGSGYVEQPAVTFSGGGGSGAAAYATVGSTPVVRSLGSSMSFSTPNGEGFRVQDGGTASAAYWVAFGTNATPSLRATSSVSGSVETASAVPLQFKTSTTLEQFRINHVANSVNYPAAAGAATGSVPGFYAQGTDANISLGYRSKGSGYQFFYSDGGANVQFAVGYVANSVNYLTVFGGATGTPGSVLIAAQGSDASINTEIRSKGSSGVISFANGNGQWGFYVTPTAGTVNFLNAVSAGANVSPSLNARGTDTNIGIALTPKGNGNVYISSTANSISSTTGALLVSGGIGVVGNVYVSNVIGVANYTLPTTGGGAGQVLTINGAGGTSWSNKSVNYIPFTSSGTYTKSANVVSVAVWMCAGGGGGGFGGTYNPVGAGGSGGGGGGGGSWYYSNFIASALTPTVTVTVGAGGFAGNANTLVSIGAVTFAPSSNVITGTSLPTLTNLQVQFTTTGTLPANFATGTNYYIITGSTATSMNVSATLGGNAITASDSGTGTHTVNYVGYGGTGGTTSFGTYAQCNGGGGGASGMVGAATGGGAGGFIGATGGFGTNTAGGSNGGYGATGGFGATTPTSGQAGGIGGTGGGGGGCTALGVGGGGGAASAGYGGPAGAASGSGYDAVGNSVTTPTWYGGAALIATGPKFNGPGSAGANPSPLMIGPSFPASAPGGGRSSNTGNALIGGAAATYGSGGAGGGAGNVLGGWVGSNGTAGGSGLVYVIEYF